MAITIGGASLKTRKPTALDDALLASTGCDPAEIGRLLGGNPSSHLVARALVPHLVDAIDVHELAARIDPDRDDVLDQVRKLYGVTEEAIPSSSGGSAPTDARA